MSVSHCCFAFLCPETRYNSRMSPEDPRLASAAGRSCCGSSSPRCQETIPGSSWNAVLPPELPTREGTVRLEEKHQVCLIRLIRNKYFSKFNKSSIFLIRLLDRNKIQSSYLIFFKSSKFEGLLLKLKCLKPDSQGPVRDRHYLKGLKHQWSHCLPLKCSVNH